MEKLEILNLAEKLTAYEGKKIGDKDLTSLLPEAKVEKPFSVETDKLIYSIGAFADIGISVFNSEDDVDQDEILGEKHLIKFEDGKAWLKYSTQAGIKAKGNGTLGSLGISIEKDALLVLNTYKIHSPDDPVNKAVTTDIADFVTIASKSSIIKNLKPGEAVSIHVRARLKSNIELHWSDIFASSLRKIGAILQAGETFKIDIDASASIKFNFSLEDFFELIILKSENGSLEVSLKKSSKNNINLSAGLLVEVDFAEPSAVDNILTNFYTSLLDMSESEARELISGIASEKELKISEKILSHLARKFGKEKIEKVDHLKESLHQINEQVISTVSEIAKSKVKLGLNYEYAKIRQEQTLFRASFSKDAFLKHHENLLKFNLKDVLEESKSGEEITLKKFFYELSVKKRKAWGIGLNIGNLISFSGKNLVEDELNIIKNGLNKSKLSYTGTRMHLGNWGKNETRYGASFYALMNNFCSSESPLFTDMDFGLEVITHRTEKKTSKIELKEWIDQAVLWGAVNPGDLIALNDELAYLLKTKEVSFTLQLKLGNQAFVKLLPSFAQGDLKFWAHVMASAMPYIDSYEVRKNLFLRRSAYAELWYLYLSNPIYNPQFWSGIAEKNLFTIDKNLSLWEGQENSPKSPDHDSFSHLASSYTVEKKIKLFAEGFRLINDKYIAGVPVDTTLSEAFKKMDDFWTSRFLIRTFGRYLIEMATIMKVSQDLETIFTIAYKDGQQEKIINISQAIEIL